MSTRYLVTLSLALGLAGCGDDQRQADAPATRGAPSPDASVPPRSRVAEPAAPVFDAGVLRRGRRLYLEHCARCHGEDGQGAPDWTQRGPDGKYPAPPLNGTGHAWHHPMAALRHTIKHGTEAVGGSMPARGDRLTDEEIDAIISWFQSEWPRELYRAWERRQ